MRGEVRVEERQLLDGGRAGVAVAAGQRLSWAVPAGAHGALVYSEPPAGSAVDRLSSRVVLVFTDVVAVEEVTVRDPTGT